MRCRFNLVALKKISISHIKLDLVHEFTVDSREFDLQFLPVAGMKVFCVLQHTKMPWMYSPQELDVKNVVYDMSKGTIIVDVFSKEVVECTSVESLSNPEEGCVWKFHYRDGDKKYTFPEEIVHASSKR